MTAEPAVVTVEGDADQLANLTTSTPCRSRSPVPSSDVRSTSRWPARPASSPLDAETVQRHGRRLRRSPRPARSMSASSGRRRNPPWTYHALDRPGRSRSVAPTADLDRLAGSTIVAELDVVRPDRRLTT